MATRLGIEGRLEIARKRFVTPKTHGDLLKAISDVRKSIHFCRTVNLEILGLVENMG